MTLLLDTAVFIYAVGAEHPYRRPSRRIVQRLADGDLIAEISSELVQEYVHVRCRRGIDRATATKEAKSIISLCHTHDVGTPIMQTALHLFRTFDRLHMRDAVHAATALAHRATAIVSPDRAFDDIPGLVRLDIDEAAESPPADR